VFGLALLFPGAHVAAALTPTKISIRSGGKVTKQSVEQFTQLTGVRYQRKLKASYANLANEDIGSARMKDVPHENVVEYLKGLSPADLRALYGGKLRAGVTAKMYLGQVAQVHGFGVFAEEAILPGRAIGEFTGAIEPNGQDPKFAVRKTVEGGHFSVNARHAGNYTRWLNHSSAPNAKIVWVTLGGVPHPMVVAIKAIQPHEQVFLDYRPPNPEKWKELPRTWEAVQATSRPGWRDRLRELLR
jgi:hypothetical protein